jgi:hypothetical protein
MFFFLPIQDSLGGSIRCRVCPQTFGDANALQIHTFLEHGTASGGESPPVTPPPAAQQRAQRNRQVGINILKNIDEPEVCDLNFCSRRL